MTMSRILIVCLLQVVLAQYPFARPYIRTNINSGRHFYFRDPDNRNLEIRNQNSELGTADFNNYRSYSEQNVETLYGNGHSNYQQLNNRRPSIKTNEYPLTNGPEIDHYNVGAEVHDESHGSGKVNTAGRRYHRVNINQRKAQLRASDEQNILNTNLDTGNSNLTKTENIDVSRTTNKYVELTTVPVVLVMSVTLKTNPNIHSRFADNEKANDSLVEIRQRSDSVTFSDIDNLKQDTLDKPTTDNEVRFNKNDTHDENEDDRWIWSEVTTTTTSTEKVLTSGDLDDRTSLNGDGCPTGQAKVKGICIDKH